MFSACTLESAELLAHLRRLVLSRWAVLALLALFVMIAPGLIDIPLPQWPLLGVVLVCALFNALAAWRMRHAQVVSACELLSQMLFDMTALSAAVFLSGGAANPLVSLLLPPVAIAALTLPARLAALVALAAISAYSLLMNFYLPLPISDASRATRLHLLGMWLIFVISAAMIAWLIIHMTRQIRERDAALATAREQVLRDERITALGTLAAGAAHELGTPLATMNLIAGELLTEPDLPPAIQDDLTLLRQQIGICKEILTGLSRRAGAERLEQVQTQNVTSWLEQLRQHWHALRPQASSTLHLPTKDDVPQIIADPRLEQALLNLLNNAANLSNQNIDIRLDWSTSMLSVEIHDHGPGFPPAVLNHGGHTPLPAHEGGAGIGLLLTRSAIEQLGGTLTLSNPTNGGALARIELPRKNA